MSVDPIHLWRRIQKNLRAEFASSTWLKKAVWLAADHPESIRRSGGQLTFLEINLSVEPGCFEFLLDAHTHLLALHRHGGFSFHIEDGVLLADNDRITVEATTAEELFILHEIYLKHDYDFFRPEGSVVVDIGMNVGYASLFFASNPDVEHVYGFEPFAPTFAQFQKNLERNRALSDKITGRPYGLASRKLTATANYDSERKGQMGLRVSDRKKTISAGMRREKVEMRPFLSEIERIAERHPSSDLICKMDCEGSEYDIFSALCSSMVPRQVKVFLLEWHGGNSLELVRTLCMNGFQCIRTFKPSRHAGMIYAFRD